jgi:hypothetical protein
MNIPACLFKTIFFGRWGGGVGSKMKVNDKVRVPVAFLLEEEPLVPVLLEAG